MMFLFGIRKSAYSRPVEMVFEPGRVTSSYIFSKGNNSESNPLTLRWWDDLLSLLEDARRDVDQDVVDKMYRKFIKKLSTKDEEKFNKEYKILAINRHLKVIGIFSRLYMRDKKKSYLKHIPRLWRLIEENLSFNSLNELNKWINKFFPKKFRIKPKG